MQWSVPLVLALAAVHVEAFCSPSPSSLRDWRCKQDLAFVHPLSSVLLRQSERWKNLCSTRDSYLKHKAFSFAETGRSTNFRFSRSRASGLMMTQLSPTSEASTVLESLGFNSDQVRNLLSIAQTGTAAVGEIILKEGSDILAPIDESRVFLILNGKVSVSKGNKFFTSVSRGDFLGERRFLELEVLDSLGKLRSNPIEEIFALVDEDKSGGVSPGRRPPRSLLNSVHLVQPPCQDARCLVAS
jgi:hypothetical protein